MKVATISVAVAVAALGGLGWMDTADYRALMQSYRAAAQAPLTQLQAQEQQDAARYRHCDVMRTENKATNTIDFTAEGRGCLIAALEQTASVQGALVLARNASVALTKTPDDKPLRAAALGAIDKARTILAGQKPWLYDRLEQIQHAHGGSLVMRMLAAPAAAQPSFASQSTLLDQAEYSIHQPKLYQSRQIWRLEALHLASR